jgi:hypothetical protein
MSTADVGTGDAFDHDPTADATAEGAVAAAFACAVVDDDDVATALPETLRWALDVWSAGVDEAPLWLVHDLGTALLRGRTTRFVGAAPPAFDVDSADAALLRAARLAFEDRVAAAWLLDPSFLAAHVVVAGLPAAVRARGVAHAVALALGRALAPTGDGARAHALVPGNVARLRAAIAHWTGAGRAEDRDALARRATGAALAVVVAQLASLRERLVGRALFRDEDLWELSHLHELPSEAARLALRTLHATKARIPPPSPSLVAALRRRARDVAVDDETADTFPAGGFDAMSTKGTLENLVRSEVGYVGEGAAVDDAGRPVGPDLFDVRFVEGELLYYTRDESPLFEARRPLVFVIEDVGALRSKVASLPTQTLVLVAAACLRAHQDISDAVGPAAVHTTIALFGADERVVAEERALLAISLRAEVLHQRAAVVVPDEAPPQRHVVFSRRPAPDAMRADPRQRPARLWIEVGGARWVVDDGVDSVAVDVAAPQALRAVVDWMLLAGHRR